jgi:hypothetical protein
MRFGFMSMGLTSDPRRRVVLISMPLAHQLASQLSHECFQPGSIPDTLAVELTTRRAGLK